MQELQKTGSTPDPFDSDEALRLLRKKMGGEPLSKDEALWVWDTMHEVQNRIAGLPILLHVWDELTIECSKGARCAVCGGYMDKTCWTEC